MKRLVFFCTLWLLLLPIVGCQQDNQAPTTPVSETILETQPPPTAVSSINSPTDTTPAPNATTTATSPPTFTPTATATPSPPKELTICLKQEPLNLYIYGDDSLPAAAVRHALYENLYTSLGYDYQPQGLTKLPDLADGDAVITLVEVDAGDLVVTAGDNITHLALGNSVVNADGETVSFEGTPITMAHLTVEFTLQPMVWSDGTPVTAADSVYSFQINADPITPGSKFRVERTASYTALDDHHIRWVGLPGYLPNDYKTHIWQPLPQHQLASFTASELLEADEVNQRPLSSGPFVLQTWELGQSITVSKNPHYYRASEGLPHIDTITFLLYDTIEQPDDFDTIPCDILTQDIFTLDQVPALLAAQEQGSVVAHIQQNTVFEHLDFGINSYDEYGDDIGRPDWFQDTRVRQAIAYCLDRQRLVDELMYGQSEVMHTYIPVSHPLYPNEIPQWAYDPQQGNALLDEIGHIDFAGDGIRQNASSGLPFIITLGTEAGNELRQQINTIIQENLQACGIQVELYTVPTAEWYADGPLGPLFGRQFDLAQFAWRMSIRPSCQLWLSQNIPGPEAIGYGGWGNVNVTGWQNDAFDTACQNAINTLPGMAAYGQNHQEAARLLAQELPIIPLFAHINAAVIRSQVRNFHLDATQPSELWNVYEIDIVTEQDD